MSQSTNFNDFQFASTIQKAIADLKFTEATEIQARAIPSALSGRDVMACAETGSGKTAAYCLPIISGQLQSPDSVALILAPTRELAQQISDFIRKLTAHTKGLQTALLIGGTPMGRQMDALRRKPRIIVGTPGRVTDHLRRKTLNLAATRYLVLDEGDRMLDMGFAPQLEQILKFVPQKRQTFLFTATLPSKVKQLAQKYLQNPEQIMVGAESQPVQSIVQTTIQTTHQKKNDVLMDQLNTRKGSVIVFTKTKRGTDRLAGFLEDFGYAVSRIHGDRTQAQRNNAIRGLREGKVRVLVATDVAARGIDIPQIAHVINYDLPMFDDDYVHRVGRTARAGAKGEALSLITPDDYRRWITIARKFKLPIPADMKISDSGGKKKKGRNKPFGQEKFGNRFKGRAGSSSNSSNSSHSRPKRITPFA